MDLGVYWFSRDAMTNYYKNWWLKTTEIYFITFLEARSLKSASLDRNQGVGSATFAV